MLIEESRKFDLLWPHRVWITFGSESGSCALDGLVILKDAYISGELYDIVGNKSRLQRLNNRAPFNYTMIHSLRFP